MGYDGTYNGTPGPVRNLCHNCRFDVTMIELEKIAFKCPRCGSGMFDKTRKVKHINQPESGDNSPLVPGKPLRS